MAVARAPRPRGLPKSAAIYARISDDRTGQGLGVARQKEDCEKLARSRGWHVADVYVDNDISAYGGKARPEYRRLLEDIKSGAVDGLIAWHPDRLHRSPRELEEFIDLIEAGGISILTVQGGEYDLGTASGRMTARVVGAVARAESEQKSERIRRKAEQLAQQGKISGGGDRPFGYERDRRTIRADEAKLIREAARRVLAGETLAGVARDWERRGVRTTAGKPFNVSPLRRILVSGRISGQREHLREIIGPAEWPGIIRPTDTARLRALLLDPNRRTTAGPVPKKLLSGIASCVRCGSALVSRPKSGGQARYGCLRSPGTRGCGRTYIQSEPLDELVSQSIIVALDGPALAKAIRAERRADESSPDLARSVAEDEEQLAELAREWAEKRIGRAEWMAAREAIERRLQGGRARLSRERRTTALDDYAGRAGALTRAWPNLSTDKRRAIIQAIVEKVEITPAVRGRNRFDAERVTIRWRF